MNRQYVLVGIVVLVALAGTGALAIYSPADATASAPSTPTELDGSYTVTETILVDGEPFVERESVVDAGTAEQRAIIAYEEIAYDHYWTGDGEQYTKATAETDERLEEWLADADGEVVRTFDDEHGAVLAVSDSVDSAADGPRGYTFPDRLVHSQLELLAFVETGTTTVDGATLETYEVETGWTKIEIKDDSENVTAEPQYVTDSEGELRVDSDGQLRHANITVERVDAETWGEYLLEQVRGDAWTTTVEYEVTDAADDVRPEWMDDE